MDRIIAKYLKKDLSLEEQHRLSKWLQEDDRNADVLRALEKYWNHYQSDIAGKQQEVEQSILARLKVEEVEHTPGRRIIPVALYKVAAVLVVICAAVLSVYLSHDPGEVSPVETSYIEKVSLPGQNITTRLPDGSIVKLNAGSKLIAPEHFDGNTREVRLIGEAFFDVARNESKPFIIHTDDFSIKVLGTSFNVKAYPEMESGHVAVKTGKVSVKANSNLSVELSPDQMVSISEAGDLSEVTMVDNDLIFGWVDGKLVFRGNTLDEVFNTIERWYGVEVKTGSNFRLPEEHFTGTFDESTLREVMTQVSKVFGFDYEIENKIIQIREEL